MDSRWLWAILLIIIVVAGGWYLLSRPTPTEAPTVTENQTATTSDSGAPPAESLVPAPVTVTYTDQGFSPKSVTVVEGQTVTWVNNSTKKMWVASAPHPAHTVYDGTNEDTHCAAGYTGPKPFDECVGGDAGASYSFTFTKAGSYKYHNHTRSTDFGEVVVTAAGGAPVGGGAAATTSVQVNVR